MSQRDYETLLTPHDELRFSVYDEICDNTSSAEEQQIQDDVRAIDSFLIKDEKKRRKYGVDA